MTTTNKKLAIILAALITPFLLSFAQSNDTDRMKEVRQAIEVSNAIYFQAFVKNDPSIFLDRYADDACLMAPLAPPQCGKESIAAFFRENTQGVVQRNICHGIIAKKREFGSAER